MKFFNAEQIIRLTAISDNSVNIANQILENKVQIFPSLPCVDVDNLLDLCEMHYNTAQSTYSLYAYALYPVSYLLNAYEITNNKKYLDKALDFVVGFIRWEESDKKINAKRLQILFGDHAVSNRTQAICYLIVALSNENYLVPDEIIKYLVKNGQYLSDINNYSHYNHGLMMDLALLGLIRTLQGINISFPEDFNANLLERLSFSLDRDLTEDGVHIENSPGYHFWMVRFLEKITPSLENYSDALFVRASTLLDKAKEYANYITRFDKSIPIIGDTHKGMKYSYIDTLKSKHFTRSDIVIFRGNTTKTWAYFASGYRTQTHKHEDNGVINIFYKGEDLLIDSGFLNYENTSESLGFKAVRSHNTVAPKGEQQKLNSLDIREASQYKSNLSNSKIIGFHSLNDIEYSIALIDEYASVPIARLVLFVNDNNFIIFDKSLSDTPIKLEQFFNISPSFEITNIDNKKYRLDSDINKDVFLSCSVSDGINHTVESFIEDSFCSEAFNVKTPIKRIVFESDSRNLCSVIGNVSGNISVNGTVATINGNLIDMDELIIKSLNVESYISSDGDKVAIHDGKFYLETPAMDGGTYAFYIEKKGHIEKIFYQADNFYQTNVKVEPGYYLITFFYKDSRGSKTFRQVRILCGDDGKIVPVNGDVIAEEKNYKITHYDVGADITFIVFNGLGSNKNSKTFALDYLLHKKINVIACVQDGDNQYQDLSLEDFGRNVLPLIKDKKVFLYGSSVGGYCAFYYAGVVNGCVISAAPRHHLLKNLNQKHGIKAVPNVDLLHDSLNVNRKTDQKTYIFLDPHVEMDVDFIQQVVLPAYPNTEIYESPFAGHAVLYHLNKTKQLNKIIDNIISGIEQIEINTDIESEFVLYEKSVFYYNLAESYLTKCLENENKIDKLILRKAKDLKNKMNLV